MIQKFITKLSPSEKKILYVTVAIVMLACLDRLFLGPVMSKLGSLDDEIFQQENRLKQDERFLSYKNQILNEQKSFGKYYSSIQVSDQKAIASFSERIELLADESEVSVIKVIPSQGKQSKGYQEYFASLECIGPLENLTKFIYNINTSKDLMKVTQLNLAPKKSTSANVTATMTVMKIIILKEDG